MNASNASKARRIALSGRDMVGGRGESAGSGRTLTCRLRGLQTAVVVLASLSRRGRSRPYDQKATVPRLAPGVEWGIVFGEISVHRGARDGGDARCPSKVYDVPRRLGQARLCRRREIPGDVRALDQGPRRVLGRARQAHRLDQAVHQGQEHLLRPAQRLDQMVRGRRHQRRASIASTGISPKRGDQTAIIWEGDDPDEIRSTSPMRELHERSLPLRQCAEGARRQEGRPRHDLPADDPRGGLRDAGLRAHRRGPFGRVRRLLARRARRPHRGLRHRRSSSPPTRACAAASKVPLKANVDAALDEGRRRRSTCSSSSAPAATSPWNDGRDVWYARGRGEGVAPIARPSR